MKASIMVKNLKRTYLDFIHNPTIIYVLIFIHITVKRLHLEFNMVFVSFANFSNMQIQTFFLLCQLKVASQKLIQKFPKKIFIKILFQIYFQIAFHINKPFNAFRSNYKIYFLKATLTPFPLLIETLLYAICCKQHKTQSHIESNIFVELWICIYAHCFGYVSCIQRNVCAYDSLQGGKKKLYPLPWLWILYTQECMCI